MAVQVLITGKLHDSAMQRFFEEKLFSITYEPDCSRKKLMELLPAAQVIVSRSETTLDREALSVGSQLKVLARAAVGVGNIDLEYATEKGILVLNTPGQNTNSAAELTMSLLLAMLRNQPQAQSHLKMGGWERHRFNGRELRGKKVGIVGLGNVGHRVARFCKAFDCDVYAYDPYIGPDIFTRHGVMRMESQNELLEQVDILTLHVPLNSETKGMIGAADLARMKPGSYLVNAARGGIVDESAMVALLDSGHLAGVGIDTFVDEPHPLAALVGHEKCWCTPHIGASTEEAQIAIGNTVFDQVMKAVAGGVVDYPVNLPQIGVLSDPLQKIYAVLAEKLGILLGQIIDFNPARIEILYRGDLAELDHSLIRLGFMKGYGSQVVDGYVSYVNAQSHFERMGIVIAETLDPAFQSYKSAIKIVVSGAERDQVLGIGGIVFDGKYPKISLINSHHFEMDPNGTVLLVENDDVPGVIGQIGHFLAAKKVNISTFELSRNRSGGRAMSLIKLDSDLDSDDLKEMRGLPNIVSVKAARL